MEEAAYTGKRQGGNGAGAVNQWWRRLRRSGVNEQINAERERGKSEIEEDRGVEEE